MNQTLRNFAVVTAALLTVGAWTAAQADGGGQTRFRTRLTGAAIKGERPHGEAEFRIQDGGRMRLRVEADDVRLPHSDVMDVSIVDNGVTTSAGQFRLQGGQGELELDTNDGNIVPVVNKGDMVIVSTGGTTILAGVF